MSVFRAGGKKSSESVFPSIRPTLDLDFANSKTLDPRITFTRASGGTYVGADGLIKYAGVNEARFDHDPVTGESLGLLVEVGSTNQFSWSQDFNNAYWTKLTVSIQSNATVAPDGTLTANKLIEAPSSVGDTSQSFYRFVTPSAGEITFSVFVKAAEVTQFQLSSYEHSVPSNPVIASFNLTTGTVISTSGLSISASITPYPNGWYRCSTTGVVAGTYSSWIFRLMKSGVSVYTGDGTSGLYIWGAQLETVRQEGKGFLTSYIPTQSGARTRGLEYSLISGKNFTDFYNQTEGTIALQYSYNTVGTQNCCPISFDDATNTQVIVLANFVPNGDRWLSSGGVNIDSISYSIGQNLKRSIGYKLNDFGSSVLGDSPVLDTDYTPPIPTQLCIGHAGYFNSSRINGHIKRIKYYPKRLPNEQLIALTR